MSGLTPLCSSPPGSARAEQASEVHPVLTGAAQPIASRAAASFHEDKRRVRVPAVVTLAGTGAAPRLSYERHS
jgi:hypothetical protein